MDIEYPRALQRQFEEALTGGEWPAGEEVTSAALAARFQAPVDRMRLVLDSAYRKGIVDRVEAQQHRFRILGVTRTDMESVFTHTARAGFKPTSLVRAVEVEPATPQVAQKLEVAEGSPVYRYVRTRNVDDQPLANQTNYIPYEVCPGLEDDDVFRYSFQRLLEEKYLAVLAEMVEEFRLVPATAQDREVLGLAEGASILLIDRVALSPTRRPLVWANIRIRPDRYEYVAALWPQAAELLRS